MTSRKRPPEQPIWLAPDEVATAPLDHNMELIADRHTSVALMSDYNYKAYFEENIRAKPAEAFAGLEHRQCRLSGYKRLCCPSNRSILIVIARNSDSHRQFVAKKRGVPIESVPQGARLTIQALARSFWDAERRIRRGAAVKNGVDMYRDEQCAFDVETVDDDELIDAVASAQSQRSFEAHVRRIVEAGEVFGLMTLKNGVIEGTARLHEAMVRTGAFDMCSANAAIEGEDNG